MSTHRASPATRASGTDRWQNASRVEEFTDSHRHLVAPHVMAVVSTSTHIAINPMLILKTGGCAINAHFGFLGMVRPPCEWQMCELVRLQLPPDHGKADLSLRIPEGGLATATPLIVLIASRVEGHTYSGRNGTPD